MTEIKTKVRCRFCNKEIEDWLTHTCELKSNTKLWGHRIRMKERKKIYSK